VGGFKDGLKNGHGWWRRHKENPSSQYEGEYSNDKKHGWGTFTWASGNIFKGNYKFDEWEGEGEMIWTDGSSYKGNWVKGIQHGWGKMIFPDGKVKDGYFENNVFKGETASQKLVLELKEIQEWDSKWIFISKNNFSKTAQKSKIEGKELLPIIEHPVKQKKIQTKGVKLQKKRRHISQWPEWSDKAS
jgi:hypothetical protein